MSRMCPALSLVPGITVHLLVEPAAAVLAAHGSAERVPVQSELVGSAEAQRVRDALAAASGGGGEVCVA